MQRVIATRQVRRCNLYGVFMCLTQKYLDLLRSLGTSSRGTTVIVETLRIIDGAVWLGWSLLDNEAMSQHDRRIIDT